MNVETGFVTAPCRRVTGEELRHRVVKTCIANPDF